ncbi:MAG: hypothetical protein J2P57_22180 [Acidimicrobiaceae bacterium]|nr:hypothetical protein [Acidimicrobiaceae bacterium]
MLAGVRPSGDPVEIRDDDVRLLVFLTSSCLPCRLWWAELGTRPHPAAVIVTPDPTTEDARAVAALDQGRVPVVMSSAAWIDHGVRGAPTVLLVRDDAVVARAEPHTWEEFDALLAGG